MKTTAKTIVERVLSGLKFNYLKEDDSELGQVDFGVLTVAMMVAALDGVIEQSELKAFSKLSDQCRVGAGEKAARYESALHSAGYMLLVSRSGASQKAIVQTFVAEAEKVLPEGFAGGKGEDIRRALVIWITMGLSDGRFSGIERTCIMAFCARIAEVMQKRRDCKREKLWLGLRPTTLASYSRKGKASCESKSGDEADWLAKAEVVAASGELKAIREFILNG